MDPLAQQPTAGLKGEDSMCFGKSEEHSRCAGNKTDRWSNRVARPVPIDAFRGNTNPPAEKPDEFPCELQSLLILGFPENPQQG